MKAIRNIEIRIAHLGVTLAVLVLMALFFLGWLTSPRNKDDRPVLLSPNVRAVEAYRRDVRQWIQDWQSLDATLTAILYDETPYAELLTLSRSNQESFEVAIQLSQSVDATDAPASLIGLHDQVAAVANAYVQAAVASSRWVSAPTPENEDAANDAVGDARLLLQELAKNDWVNETAAP